MKVTTRLVKELVRDIEQGPASWLRAGEWLFKNFDFGRIGLRLFARPPYMLELDASVKQHGNVDSLSWHQSWLLRIAKKHWLVHKHETIWVTLVQLSDKTVKKGKEA